MHRGCVCQARPCEVWIPSILKHGRASASSGRERLANWSEEVDCFASKHIHRMADDGKREEDACAWAREPGFQVCDMPTFAELCRES